MAIAAFAALLFFFWPARISRSDNFVFYLPGNREIVPLIMVDGAPYLPLLQVLNILGTVSGLDDRRTSLKVWIGSTELDLRRDGRKVRVERQGVKLKKPVRVSGGRWMVPIDFLDSVLPKLVSRTLEYRPGDLRMFVGDVKPATFSVRLDPLSDGARLTVRFSSPVKAQTASTNGKWVVFLGEQPIEPLEPIFRFKDHYVSAVQFDDQDGVPKLVITPASGSLNFYSSSADQGRALEMEVRQAAALPQPGVAAKAAGRQGTPPPSGAPAVAGSPPSGAKPSAPPPPPLPTVVLDAGHGGQDGGARSQDRIAEKDLVAQMVERTRTALATTKKFRIILTRTGDTDPSIEERTITANLARPVAFLTFHGGDLGSRSPQAAVYTYQPSAPPPPKALTPRLFVPWQWAQETELDPSRQLASALCQQLGRVSGLDISPPQQAPVRQLRSISAPAIAVEFGSLTPSASAAPLASPAFQQEVANAVAGALVAFRGGK